MFLQLVNNLTSFSVFTLPIYLEFRCITSHFIADISKFCHKQTTKTMKHYQYHHFDDKQYHHGEMSITSDDSSEDEHSTTLGIPEIRPRSTFISYETMKHDRAGGRKPFSSSANPWHRPRNRPRNP